MNYSINSFKVCIYKVNPDNTREQLLGFYNYARTEYKDLEGYPEYI